MPTPTTISYGSEVTTDSVGDAWNHSADSPLRDTSHLPS